MAAASVTHTKVSAIPDVGNAALVEPSDWNDPHVIAAGGADTQIQFNNATAIDGDSNLTWVAADGLTDKKYLAVGSYATIGQTVIQPGDAAQASYPHQNVIIFNEQIDVASSAVPAVAMCAGVAYRPLVDGVFLAGLEFLSWVNDNSTHDIARMNGLYVGPQHNGSGDIAQLNGVSAEVLNLSIGDVGNLYGITADAEHVGSGTCDEVVAVRAITWSNTSGGGTTDVYGVHVDTYGATFGTQLVINQYGIAIEDQSGIGSVRSENIRSKGAGSLNVFEGAVNIDSGGELSGEFSLSGGAVVTSSNQGTKSSGTFTVDPGVRPLQYITNGGAFTLAAPADDGSMVLLVTNNGSAGAITFSGFSVGASTGDALTTTNTEKFSIHIWRVNSVAGYRIAAHQ